MTARVAVAMDAGDVLKPGDAVALIADLRASGRTALDEREGKSVLSAFGISVPHSVTAATPAEAALACASLASPLVVKALSSQALHKSDIGALRLGLRTPDEVRAAAEAILSGWPANVTPPEGFLVEEMAPAGLEIVIGGFRDPQFGPMIMVGVGGVFVEILADTAFRVCPIGRGDAVAMLGELRAQALLDGARGKAPVSREAIVDMLLRIGGEDGLLMRLADEVSELDVNPLIVSATGAVAVDARFVLAGNAVGSSVPRAAMPESFEPLFAPRTVAVAGVSASGKGPGNRFIANLRALDFAGDIYPVHPSADTLEGLPAYRSLAETPKPVDYAFVAIPRDGVPALLREARGNVRFAQIMTSGFGEAGAGEDALLDAAREGGVRLLGPNCLGTYSPSGRITLAETRKEQAVPGPIGFISQSGGIGIDMVRTGQMRGLRYSGVVTIGNSADIGPNDLLEHFLNDPSTSIIGMYLEDIGDGRRFFDLLKAASGRKPVVLLKGGRSQQGQKAVVSHTGALAGDDRVWSALAAQTGAVLVETIEELINVLLLLQTTAPSKRRPTRELVLFGNGGGAGVVATDTFARYDFNMADLSDATRQGLRRLELPPGASDENPVDLPANALNRSNGLIAEGILGVLAEDAGVDVILVHLNMPVLISYRESRIVQNIVDCCLALRKAGKDAPHLLLVLRSDGSEEVDGVRREQRQRAVAAGLPVFDSFADAARALRALARVERFVAKAG